MEEAACKEMEDKDVVPWMLWTLDSAGGGGWLIGTAPTCSCGALGAESAINQHMGSFNLAIAYWGHPRWPRVNPTQQAATAVKQSMFA
jgi:hypothetical protein